MSREAKTNLILFSIVLVLALIVWLKPGIKTNSHHYISSLDRDEISEIHLQRQGLDNISLNKHHGLWFLSEPYQLPANPLRVNSITALVEKRSYTRFQVNNTELNRYHLDKPLVRISFDNEQFIIGSADPLMQRRYTMNISDNTQSAKKTVHLIDGLIFYQLRAALDSFISLRLIPAQAKIKRISWPGKRLKLTHTQWQLTPSPAAAVSNDSIVQLIHFWEQAQATKVETNIKINIGNKIRKKNSISIEFMLNNTTETQIINYVIIQQGQQIKLLRPDINIAYWISPQTLKMISGFSPVPVTSSQKNKH